MAAELSAAAEAQFENAVPEADDDSEDEEFYRRQIMEFDIFKYDKKYANDNQRFSQSLIIFTACILALSIVLLLQIYN